MSEHRNSLDNSEFNTSAAGKDVTPAAASFAEQESLTKYMENLKIRAEIEKATDLKINMKVNQFNATNKKWESVDKKLDIKELLPIDSEFEKTRKLIIVNLNSLGPEDPGFRKYASRFGSNSIFELSSRITNYVLDEKRRKEAYDDLIGGALKKP